MGFSTPVSNENHFAIFIMYPCIPKSGLIGGLYENASGIFILYACSPQRNHVIFFIPMRESIVREIVGCIHLSCLCRCTHPSSFQTKMNLWTAVMWPMRPKIRRSHPRKGSPKTPAGEMISRMPAMMRRRSRSALPSIPP